MSGHGSKSPTDSFVREVQTRTVSFPFSHDARVSLCPPTWFRFKLLLQFHFLRTVSSCDADIIMARELSMMAARSQPRSSNGWKPQTLNLKPALPCAKPKPPGS